MTIAAIMVYVDFDEAAEARVAAAGLARQFNAALIGVAGWALRKFNVVRTPELASHRAGKNAQERISDELGACTSTSAASSLCCVCNGSAIRLPGAMR